MSPPIFGRSLWPMAASMVEVGRKKSATTASTAYASAPLKAVTRYACELIVSSAMTTAIKAQAALVFRISPYAEKSDSLADSVEKNPPEKNEARPTSAAKQSPSAAESRLAFEAYRKTAEIKRPAEYTKSEAADEPRCCRLKQYVLPYQRMFAKKAKKPSSSEALLLAPRCAEVTAMRAPARIARAMDTLPYERSREAPTVPEARSEARGVAVSAFEML